MVVGKLIVGIHLQFSLVLQFLGPSEIRAAIPESPLHEPG